MRNEIKKEKSIARTKKSTIRLIDAATDAGLSLVPGGAGIYKFGKILVQHALGFYHDRRDERLANFHEKLLENVSTEEKDKIFNTEFSVEDYYSILNQLIHDEEDEKVAIYAKVFQAILLGLIPDDFKIHILKSIRELKYSDFDLMRRIYINEKYEFVAPGNKRSQISRITRPKKPIELHSIQTLIRHGYLYEKDGTKPPWPTELNKFLAEYYTKKSSLLIRQIMGTSIQEKEFNDGFMKGLKASQNYILNEFSSVQLRFE